MIAVGRDQLSIEELKDALDNVTKGKVSAVAPPNGLYLHRVFYL